MPGFLTFYNVAKQVTIRICKRQIEFEYLYSNRRYGILAAIKKKNNTFVLRFIVSGFLNTLLCHQQVHHA